MVKDNTAGKYQLSNRLAKYSAAALAAVAGGMISTDACADQVTLNTENLPLRSSGNRELFVDILGFVTGASSFSIEYTNNNFSQFNPFPNSEIMLRGFGGPGISGTGGPGDGQIRAQSGARLAAFSSSLSAPYSAYSFPFALDVGGAFNAPTGTAGTFAYGGGDGLDGATNAFLNWGTYAPDKGDWDINGDTGTVYFQFTNSLTGDIHDAWMDIATRINNVGKYEAVITAIHVDTGGIGSIPEPSSMGLLCLGAAGVAALRRRKKNG